jgi:uncharacterized membrane protein (UPF0127 family)
MRQRTAGGIVVALIALLLVVHFAWPPVWLFDPGTYERTTVTVQEANGTELTTVEVRIADTRNKRYVGLSETDSLATDAGMLFIHSDETTRRYVMRNMSFPLDIVFIDSDGQITAIRHAAVDDGAQTGRAQYVLEVNRGWANATGVERGDTVVIPERVQ